MKPNPKRQKQPAKRDDGLSPDGKWKSFPKVPHLLQYVPTGNYFGRLKVKGKLIRQSLKTDTHTTALLRLPDFLTKHRKSKRHDRNAPVTFKDARLAFEADLDTDASIGDRHRQFRKDTVASLLKSWPGLDDCRLSAIGKDKCREWSMELAAKYSPAYFNHILWTMKAIFRKADFSDEESPLHEIKRLGIKLTKLQLPEPGQFITLVERINAIPNGRAHYCADFVEFLAYSGCRLSEARQVTWADVDFAKGLIHVQNAKSRRHKDHAPTRQVPMIEDMRRLLERMRPEGVAPSERVCRVIACEESLARGCREVGIPKLTHHDLRHLFATRCIESGVDIPTVSRWLGHKDGGALAMKVYGHLRGEHSIAMAQRVTFAAKVLPMAAATVGAAH